VTLEYIKKLMGWCPNAKITETRSRTSPANFETYDRSGGEKVRSSLNRMKRIGLLLTSIGAFVSALSLVLDSKSTISSLKVE
jgi:chromosome condensin MukBEF MukE localization factor